MKLLCTLSCLLLLAAGNSLNAQHWCDSDPYLKQQIKEDPERAKAIERLEKFTEAYIKNNPQNLSKTTAPIYKIPVVFHVVYRDSDANISEERIHAQLAKMNQDFQLLNSDHTVTPSAFSSLKADMQIEFCLATRDPDGNATNGIIRTPTTVDSFTMALDDIKKAATGGQDPWPRDQYLNVWTGYTKTKVCYGTFPGGPADRDGIVCYPFWFWNTWAVSARITMTHEAGHWLNLRHIWGDDGSACTGSDLVDDTPNQGAFNTGCPTFPHYSCTGRKDNTPNGDLYVNHMDYTTCRVMFTNGQKARSHAVLAQGGPRNIILSSPACDPVPAVCTAPWALRTKTLTTSSAVVSWANVAESSGYTLSWKPTGAVSWTGTASVTAPPYTISSLSANTSYTYEVAVSCQNANTYSSTSTFRTQPVCSNNYENNNTVNTAIALTPNTEIASQIGSAGDLDYYKFDNTAATPNMKVTLSNMPAAYTLALYKPNKNTIIGMTTGSATNNSVSLSFNTTTVGTYYIRVSGGNNYSSTTCYRLEPSLSAANFYLAEEDEIIVHEVEANNAMSIFPNPSTGSATLRFSTPEAEPVNISVTDQTGRVCSAYKVMSIEGANDHMLDTRALAAGLYFIQLSTKAGIHTLKLVVR